MDLEEGTSLLKDLRSNNMSTLAKTPIKFYSNVSRERLEPRARELHGVEL